MVTIQTHSRTIKNVNMKDLDFYLKARNAIIALEQLCEYWQTDEQGFNNLFAAKYPFVGSLEEVVAEGYEWLSTIIETINIGE